MGSARDAVPRVDALAAAGDEGGLMRFRSALLRALPLCDLRCVGLSGSRSLAAFAELMYRRFCADKRPKLIASALEDVPALRKEIRAALYEKRAISDGSKERDVLAEDWPSGVTWQTRKTVRRLAHSSSVETARGFLRETRSAVVAFRRLPTGTHSPATSIVLTKAFENEEAAAADDTRRVINEKLKASLKALNKLGVNFFEDEFGPGIKELELEFDEVVCVDYVLSDPALPAPSKKSSGCAGCSAGNQTSTGFFFVLLLIITSIRRRNISERAQVDRSRAR